MARYSAFLGHWVEVQYRAGDIVLPASGIFVADSGRSIFLEQHVEQRGQRKHFRWEIPYQFVVRIEERPEPPAPVTPPSRAVRQVFASPLSVETRESAPSLLPLSNPPKIA